MSGASNPVFEVVGKGSYGAVIKPAFPNFKVTAPTKPNERPTIQLIDDIPYEKLVTKFMKNKKSFNKSVKNAQLVKQIVPNTKYNFVPYQFQYQPENLAQMGFAINTPEFYLGRMPDLGQDVYKLQKNPGLVRKLSNHSNETLMNETLKVLQQVKQFWDAGYIHGDVRESNVLCNVKTAEITIIDFDWLTPIQNFIAKYPHYFYCHPPEEIFILALKEQTITDTVLRNLVTYTPGVRRILEQNKRMLHLFGTSPAMSAEDVIQRIFTDCMKGIQQVSSGAVPYEDMVNKYLKTIDSYGIALSLHVLFYATLLKPEHVEFRNFLYRQLFPKMWHANFLERMTIEEAIDKLQTYIEAAQFKASINLMTNEAIPQTTNVVTSGSIPMQEGGVSVPDRNSELLVGNPRMEMSSSNLTTDQVKERIRAMNIGISNPGPINVSRFKKAMKEGKNIASYLTSGRAQNAEKRAAAAKKRAETKKGIVPAVNVPVISGPALSGPITLSNGNTGYATIANVRRIVQEELSKFKLQGKTRKTVEKVANKAENNTVATNVVTKTTKTAKAKNTGSPKNFYTTNWAKGFINEQLKQEGIPTGITITDAAKFAKYYREDKFNNVNSLYKTIKTAKTAKTAKNRKLNTIPGPKNLSQTNANENEYVKKTTEMFK